MFLTLCIKNWILKLRWSPVAHRRAGTFIVKKNIWQFSTKSKKFIKIHKCSSKFTSKIIFVRPKLWFCNRFEHVLPTWQNHSYQRYGRIWQVCIDEVYRRCWRKFWRNDFQKIRTCKSVQFHLNSSKSFVFPPKIILIINLIN